MYVLLPLVQVKHPQKLSNKQHKLESLQNVKDVIGTKKKLTRALKESIINDLPKEPFGILLSGGVDSSIIAKICKDHNASFRCFCVGMEGSQDLKVAKEIASLLDLELVTKEFELDEIEQLLVKVIDILGTSGTRTYIR